MDHQILPHYESRREQFISTKSNHIMELLAANVHSTNQSQEGSGTFAGCGLVADHWRIYPTISKADAFDARLPWPSRCMCSHVYCYRILHQNFIEVVLHEQVAMGHVRCCTHNEQDCRVFLVSVCDSYMRNRCRYGYILCNLLHGRRPYCGCFDYVMGLALSIVIHW